MARHRFRVAFFINIWNAPAAELFVEKISASRDSAISEATRTASLLYRGPDGWGFKGCEDMGEYNDEE